jgi:hypothetical protein
LPRTGAVVVVRRIGGGSQPLVRTVRTTSAGTATLPIIVSFNVAVTVRTGTTTSLPVVIRVRT